MPKTYAILGATGQTGEQIVQTLLPTEHHLNIYARSKQRLESAFPAIDKAPNVTLFIGDMTDTSLMGSCLADADVVLSAIAQNRNEPGCSIAQQTALALVNALDSRRSSGDCPTVVFLAEAAIDPNNPDHRKLSRRLFHWMIHHVYTDLEKAIDFLSLHNWIPLVVACPGALLHSDAHKVELINDTSRCSPMLSYADCARGMIMMGDRGSSDRSRYVGMVVDEGRPIKGNPAALLRYLIPNLMAMVCPPLWWYFKDWWPK